jgi:hypothetical protein
VTTGSSSTAVVVLDPVFSDPERLGLAGFLAGHRGLTRDAYALDLRQFMVWCDQHQLKLFEVRRADIECFARDLEERGRARATVARRLSFLPRCWEERVATHAVPLRRPFGRHDPSALSRTISGGTDGVSG